MLEAFAHHPADRRGSGRAARSASRRPRRGRRRNRPASPAPTTRRSRRCATATSRYREQFGYVFLVCATGKTAAEMLALLRARLPQRSRHRAARRRRRAGQDHPAAAGEARRHEPDHLARARHRARPAGGRACASGSTCSTPTGTPGRVAERVTNDEGRVTDFVAARRARRADVSPDVRHRRLLRRLGPAAVLPARRRGLHRGRRRRAPPHPAAPQPVRLLHLPRTAEVPHDRLCSTKPRSISTRSARPTAPSCRRTRATARRGSRCTPSTAARSCSRPRPRRGSATRGAARRMDGLRPRRRPSSARGVGFSRASADGWLATTVHERVAPQAGTRAGRGLPHRLRGRLRRAARRRRGRHREHRGPRGRARHARGHAAAVPRHPHQVVRRGVEGARRADARDLPRHAARRDRRPAARPTSS